MGRSFCPGGVTFDGATSLLNAALVASDSPLLTFAYWIRDLSTTYAAIWTGDLPSYYNYAFETTIEQVNINLTSGDGSSVIQGSIHRPDPPAAWHHVLVSADMTASPGAMACYLDGIEAKDGGPAFVGAGGSMVFNGKVFRVGDDTFSSWLVGDLAEFWFAPGVSILNGTVEGSPPFRAFIDPVDVAKFYAGACPVDLGADGSIPTGSPPAIYLSRGPTDPASAFLTNRGTGGDFTEESGGLTTASEICACERTVSRASVRGWVG